jgi:hypothetical protein
MLCDEIRSNVQTGEGVTADKVEKLHFMKAVLKEALR